MKNVAIVLTVCTHCHNLAVVLVTRAGMMTCPFCGYTDCIQLKK